MLVYMPYFFALFVVVPIIEIAVLIKMGGIIGLLPTVALVVLTATTGVWLLRLEGLSTLNEVQRHLQEGRVPGQSILEGLMLLVGGALLLTPGFVTDTIGFVCLIPILRKPLAAWLLRRILTHTTIAVTPAGNQAPQSKIIEGEFKDESR